MTVHILRLLTFHIECICKPCKRYRYSTTIVVIVLIASHFGELLLFGLIGGASIRKLVRSLTHQACFTHYVLSTLFDIICQQVIHLSVGSPSPAAFLIAGDVCLQTGEKAGTKVSRRGKVDASAALALARLWSSFAFLWLASGALVVDLTGSATRDFSQ